jgi:hypothetical protein
MVIIRLSEADFLELGLSYAGFNAINQQRTRPEDNIRRFRAWYGAGAKTCSQIFMDLQTADMQETCIKNLDAKKLLLTLYWMKTYNTESVLAGTFGVNEKTARNWLWTYAGAIQALKHKKVRHVVCFYFTGVTGASVGIDLRIHVRQNSTRGKPGRESSFLHLPSKAREREQTRDRSVLLS